MKRIIKSLIVGCLVLSSTAAFAQKDMIFIASQTMSSTDPTMQSQLAMVGEMTMTTYHKKNMTKTVTSGGMTGTNITIFNEDTKKGIMIMDNPFMGKKWMTLDSSEDEEDDSFEVERTSETKEIMGYVCTKYIITEEGGTEIEMYTTEEIKVSGDQRFGEKVKGVALLTVTNTSQMGMSMTITVEVTEIKETKIKDSEFDMTVPEGYEEMSMDEVMGN
ncbi:MAG: hypothetical protein QNK23_18050 [Crocinitomicaceae bacterium]|nr:hypothetical protein [Crocinitomicaceae bacterium]